MHRKDCDDLAIVRIACAEQVRARCYGIFGICFNTMNVYDGRGSVYSRRTRRRERKRTIERTVYFGSLSLSLSLSVGVQRGHSSWRCDAPGWKDGRTDGRTDGRADGRAAKTLISDISNFYEASLENISTDCAGRMLSRRSASHFGRLVTAATAEREKERKRRERKRDLRGLLMHHAIGN